MKHTFYAVSNSSTVTSVLEWQEDQWVLVWDNCPVLNTKPYIFKTPVGNYTPIALGWLRDAEGMYGEDFPKDFWEYQPCILINAEYLSTL